MSRPLVFKRRNPVARSLRHLRGGPHQSRQGRAQLKQALRQELERCLAEQGLIYLVRRPGPRRLLTLIMAANRC